LVQRAGYCLETAVERIMTFDCAFVDGDCAVHAQQTTTIRDLDGKVLRIYNQPFGGAWNWERDYVYRDGQLLASVEPAAGGGEDTVHFHLDHLGSPRQITDELGVETGFHTYYPFGEEATVPSQDDVELKFTGHERDANGGGAGVLDYMHARYCSPGTGRFFSTDPIMGTAEQPQRWNRYSYTLNNPLLYTDPTGQVVYLAALSVGEQDALLRALFAFTGNEYGVDANGLLELIRTRSDSSMTATDFINEAIASATVFGVASSAGRNQWKIATNTIELNFSIFNNADYGKVDPRTFNLGSTFVHELHHGLRGSRDEIGGAVVMASGWTGPAVDFVNEIRKERGLPLRESYVHGCIGKPLGSAQVRGFRRLAENLIELGNCTLGEVTQRPRFLI
jgi:RHS repeat-associated protein